MLIQLNATVQIGSGFHNVIEDIIAPRVNSTAYNGLAIRNVDLFAVGGVMGGADSITLALCNPRNHKDDALLTAPNSVIYWKQYTPGAVESAKWLEPDRYTVLESTPIFLDWTSTVARSILIQILFEEVKLKDFQQIDMLKNKGWSI